TRGADGAVAARGSERARVDARATTVIDTTGAGDAASGAYLAARLAGDTLAGALEAAMAAAARVVGGLGAVPYSRE
ncbi:MAG: PfkB family carbohydrate kinase, partial [Acidimicrobiales bacterium]